VEGRGHIEARSGESALGNARGGGRRGRDAEELILRTVAAHADSLLRTARRFSICPDDAQDAYQRALEIFMGHAERLDAERAAGWLLSTQAIVGTGRPDLSPPVTGRALVVTDDVAAGHAATSRWRLLRRAVVEQNCGLISRETSRSGI
jgi:hypothetical protein